MTAPVSPVRQQLLDNPYVLLPLAVFFWAGNAVVGRAVHGVVPPVGLAFFRWLLAFVVLLPFAWPHLRRDLPRLRTDWPWLVVIAAFGVGCFNTFLYVGLQYTQAINGLLLQSFLPAMIGVLSFAFFRERITRFQIGGALVSMLGVVVIITRGHPFDLAQLHLNRGDLWVLVAIASYAFYSVLLRKRPQGIHPLTFALMTFLIGDLMLAPFAAWEAFGTGRSMNWGDPTTWMSVGFVAVFPSVISYLAFNRGVELIGANRAGLFIHLNPLFGSLLAIAVLGETFAVFHGIGMVLILGGIAVANRKERQRCFSKTN